MPTPPQTQEALDFLLEQLLDKLPFEAAAVLGSGDGLVMAYAGCSKDDADAFSATLAPATSTNKAIVSIHAGLQGSEGVVSSAVYGPASAEFRDQVSVNQIMVQASGPKGDTLHCIAQAGEGSQILLIAEHSNEAVMRMPFAVQEMIKKVSEHLGAAPRTTDR